ncbi:MAG: alpha/beta hydrolase [Proteobacteria bacterium]|nr:alpha/beta hydrolase [Pseudomonadota bacterium]
MIARHLVTTLPDGRNLAWVEYGPLDGKPVLYMHGGNDCGLEAGWFADGLHADVRLIAPDRPGFADSTLKIGRCFADIVPDMEHLLNHLGIDKLPGLALSGGGPHLLALAALSNLLSCISVVASPCPFEVPGFFKGTWFPIRMAYLVARYAPTGVLRGLQRAMNDPVRNMRYADRMPAPDAALFADDPARKDLVIQSVSAAHRHGFDGAVFEWRLYTRPWGFDPGTIRIPTSLWYGDQDGMAPPNMGHHLASVIPDSCIHILQNEAHLSLIHRHGPAIVADLVAI